MNNYIFYGEWAEGKLEGIGWVVSNNEFIYRGEFKNTERFGFGIEYNPKTKRHYYGEWEDGKKHGKGR